MRIFGLALCLSLGCHVGWLGLFDVRQTFETVRPPLKRDITFLGAFLHSVRPSSSVILGAGYQRGHTLEPPSALVDWRKLNVLGVRPQQTGVGFRPSVPAAPLVANKLHPAAETMLSDMSAKVPAQKSVSETLGGAAGARALLSREALGSLAEWELDTESPSRAVVLEFSIAPDGRVSNVKCVQSSGVAVLDARCIRHVARWRFVPLPPGVEPSSAVGTWRFEGQGVPLMDADRVEGAP